MDAHSLRIVYEGWVPADSPSPRVLEVDGSTVEAAWHPVAGVLDGSVPTVALVKEALAAYRPHHKQRIAAYALAVRDGAVLLTRNSARGPHPGLWNLPGGGIEHGEAPRDAVVREVAEETGLACEVGAIVTVDNAALRGTAPSGRDEELHSVGIVYDATVTDRRRASRRGSRRHHRRRRVGAARRRGVRCDCPSTTSSELCAQH